MISSGWDICSPGSAGMRKVLINRYALQTIPTPNNPIVPSFREMCQFQIDKFMPSTAQHFPNFVVEIGYRNETSERLVADAKSKYFTVPPQCRHGSESRFLMTTILRTEISGGIWGTRSLFGVGMVHRETIVDGNGNEACLQRSIRCSSCRSVHHPLMLHLQSP